MMLDLIKELYPMERDIISDGFDSALKKIGDIVPLKVHQYPTGMKAWTWTIPEKWRYKGALISNGESLKPIASGYPFNVVRYSLPVNKIVSKNELLKHVFSNYKRPGATPYEFKYYERDWGFCLPHEALTELNKSEYRVQIDSIFESGFLKIGECLIPGKADDSIAIVTHLDHPWQANDDLSGVSVAVELAKTLLVRNNHYTYRIYFLPETIGSIAYLSQNENLIPKFKYGIFLEMLGNDNRLALQYSWQENTRIDDIARYVLSNGQHRFISGSFHKIITNDEMVWNGPGVDIPIISLSRFPYPEYHTSDDTPGIISEEKLEEAYLVMVKIIDILDHDYYPKRNFKGPLFLSGQGLWVDWKTNPKLNENLDLIMLRLEGKQTVFDIAEELDMEFGEVKRFTDALKERGLVIA